MEQVRYQETDSQIFPHYLIPEHLYYVNKNRPLDVRSSSYTRKKEKVTLIDRQTDRRKDRRTETTDRKTDGRTVEQRQTDGWAGGRTDRGRQAGRQAGRQRDR
jgi:hypothetical protein